MKHFHLLLALMMPISAVKALSVPSGATYSDLSYFNPLKKMTDQSFHPPRNSIIHASDYSPEKLSYEHDENLPAMNSRIAEIAEIAEAIFYEWLVLYFFTGRYVEYLLLNQRRKKVRKGGVVLNQRRKKVRKGGVVRQQNKIFKAAKAKPALFTNDASFDELEAKMKASGVSYEDLTIDEYNSDLCPSIWVWNTIGWVNDALKTEKENGYKSVTFDEMLAVYDPALPQVARSAFRAVFVKNSPAIKELVTTKHKMLVIGWLDYMIIEHGSTLDWRSWLLSSPPPASVDLHREAATNSRSLVATLKINIQDLDLQQESPPLFFRSNSLGLIKNELLSDGLFPTPEPGPDTDKGQPYTALFYGDPVFALALSSTLYELFHTESQLTKKELYMMDYWLEAMQAKLSHTYHFNFDWYQQMAFISIEPEDLDLEKTITADLGSLPDGQSSFCHRAAFSNAAATMTCHFQNE